MKSIPVILCALWFAVPIFGESIVGRLDRIYSPTPERGELR